jgi:hypothetical protein
MTTIFTGESSWEAVVNDNSLDIEEEEAFTNYIAAQGYSRGEIKSLPLGVLEALYYEWSIKENTK